MLKYKFSNQCTGVFKSLLLAIAITLLSLSSGYAQTPMPIDLNSSVNGDLAMATESSTQSQAPALFYTFTLTKRTNIVIELTAVDSFLGRLYLLDSNGSVVAKIDDDFAWHSRIVGDFEAGTYRVKVSSLMLEESMEFVLSLKENIIKSNSIEPESIVDGMLGTASGISPRSKKRAHYYTFAIDEAKDMAITLDTHGFFGKIYLLDANQSVIASGGDGGYSRSTITQSLHAGSYMIDVTTTDENVEGIYTLRLRENIIKSSDIVLGARVESEWDLASGISPRSQKRTEYYHFTLLEPTQIKAVLSSGLQEMMYLLDSNGSLIDVDIILSGSSLIALQQLDAGSYTIDVTTQSYISQDVGSYSFELAQNSILTSPIELNSSVEGNWTESSGISPVSRSYSNYHTFVLTEPKDIVVELDSNISAFIGLIDEETRLVASYSKRITKRLSPGEYTISASKYLYDSNFGEYRLSLFENNLTAKPIALNSTINDAWGYRSGISPHSNKIANFYTFTLDKTTDILIGVTSSHTDIIDLVDSDGDVIRSHYGGYLANEESRLVATLLAGTYRIELGNEDDLREGAYILRLKENTKVVSPLLFNHQITTQWREGAYVNAYNLHYTDFYTFSLTKPTEVTITTHSDTSATLHISDQDGYFVNYRSGKDIVYSHLLDAGTYTIEFSAGYGSNELGTYSLVVGADIEPPAPIESLVVQDTDPFGAKIAWRHRSDDTVGYKIYLNDHLIDRVSGDRKYYRFWGLSPDTRYTYRVVAYNSAGESRAVQGRLQTSQDNHAWLIPTLYYPMQLAY